MGPLDLADLEELRVKQNQQRDKIENAPKDKAIQATDKAHKAGNITDEEHIENLKNAPNYIQVIEEAFPTTVNLTGRALRAQNLRNKRIAEGNTGIPISEVPKLAWDTGMNIAESMANDPAAMSEHTLDLYADFQAASKGFQAGSKFGPWGAGGGAVGSVLLRRGGKELVEKVFSLLRKGDEYVDAATGMKVDPTDSTYFMSKGSGSGSQKAWKSKRVVKGFDDAKLQVYDEAAWDYRRAREAEGKKQFMKGFVFENNSPVIRNKSGQEFMMVRKKKVNHPDKTHPDNYVLKSIWDVENDLITKSGWTKGAKDMDELRVSLNRLRTNHPDEFYHILMEYGDNAYLEHKVAKKQPWFWNRKSQNPNFAPWLDNSITRNSEGNIRLLFNESFKSLKDVTESKLRVINKTITDDNFKYVIDLEDPIGGDFARRSNPGNILIREADSGDVIGIIPDYLQELFTTNFERNFTNSKMRGILSKPDIPEFYRIKPNETMKNYRSRILDERIDLIRNKAGQFNRIGMTGHINRDLVDFYELFDRKLGWVETPRYITEQGLYD